MWQRLLNRQQEEADHHARVSLSRNHDGVDRDNPQTVLCFTQELFSFYRMCHCAEGRVHLLADEHAH